MAENTAVAQPKNTMIWIMMGFMMLVLFALVGLVLFMMSQNKSADAAKGDHGHKAEEKAEKKPAVYFELDKFVVNIPKYKKAKFLQVNMQVLSRDEAELEELKKHMPRVRNSLIFLLSDHESPAISTNEGKEQLRKKALETIQDIMKKETGKPVIEELFFTNFIMQ